MIVEKDGFKWFVRENVPTDLEPIRDYEKHVLNACALLSDYAPIFVDVGANVGKYAIRMSKYYDRVIAYEPVPSNLEVLRKNLELNEVRNVEVRPVAVSDSKGKVRIKVAGAQSKVVDGNENDTIEVDTVTLDEDLPNERSVIKVDVEGHELHVVEGGRKYALKLRPIWVIEHHYYWFGKKDENHVKIAKMLSSLGYLPFAISTTHWVYLPIDTDEKIVRSFLETYFGYHVFYTLIVPNLEKGRSWYYGIPHNWWWGMSILEFVECCSDPFSKEGIEKELDKLYAKTIEETLGISVGVPK